jgi:hypothetical protein
MPCVRNMRRFLNVTVDGTHSYPWDLEGGIARIVITSVFRIL